VKKEKATKQRKHAVFALIIFISFVLVFSEGENISKPSAYNSVILIGSLLRLYQF
jgi:hypothetical protein